MTHVAKVDFAQQARNELSSRIQHADAIAEQFRKSYSGYTSKTGRQKLAVGLLLIFAVGLLICMPNLLGLVYDLVGGYTSETVHTITIASLYCVCAFVALYALSIIVRLNRIAKIDGLIAGLEGIKAQLNLNLGAIDNTITQLEKNIRDKNVRLQPQSNVDDELARYQKTADNYAKPDGTFVDTILSLLYWPTAVLFSVAFVLLTSPLVANAMCNTFDIYEMYGAIFYIYAGLALLTFILLHVFLRDMVNRFGLGSLTLSIFSGPIAIPVLFAVCAIIALVLALISAALAVIVIIGVFAALCNN